MADSVGREHHVGVDNDAGNEEERGEDTKHDVSVGGHPLAALGLANVVHALARLQEDVRQIVDGHDNRSDAHEGENIGEGYEQDSDNVVRHHLH
mmetsp:Transcript_15821/g.26454  ORF Transcript_15821/g.26454 Transcript_15821/m.26454 type:complete len:94 (-) Transcript_15821:689-970(-)